MSSTILQTNKEILNRFAGINDFNNNKLFKKAMLLKNFGKRLKIYVIILLENLIEKL